MASSSPSAQPPMRPMTMMGGGPGRMGRRRIESARDIKGTLRRLFTYLYPHRFPLLAVVFLAITSTGLSLVGPYLLGVAIDRFTMPDPLQGLMPVIALMAGVYLLSWLAQVGENVLMLRVAQKVLRHLRQQLFEHLQTLSLSFFDRNPHGELMSRLTNDIDIISQALSQNVTQLVTSLLTMGGILVMMFVLNVWLALGSLLVLPLMVGVTVAVARRTREGYRRLQLEIGQLNGVMEETLSGERVVQAFRQQEAAIELFDRVNTIVRDVGIRAQSFAFLIPPMMTVLSNLDIAVVAGLGGWLTLRGLATVGMIATFITYARRFAQPLRQLSELYNGIQSGIAGAERVFEIIDEKPELVDAPDAIPLEDVIGDVQFDHVYFAYVPGIPVLKDINFHAAPGQTIAFVGPTGAGKTTMVNVLSRFYDIQEGAIRIDGHDIRSLQKDTLRRQLGVVLQDTFLFADTVMENIRYGRLDATDEECIAAAKLANADQFIRRLPEGYQTMLSERASNISQGQRQLLTIARAILADPGILVLDEATSSVDTRTELRIQEALLRLMEGRTSFVIAHRLSTVRQADELLIINEGQIIERGTHEELLAKKGFYYNLYMSQFKGNVPEQARLALSEPGA